MAGLLNYKPPVMINSCRGRASGRCLQKPGKGKQTLEATPCIGKALLYKPGDSEAAGLEAPRNHRFLNKIPYSGSKKSIHPKGALRNGRSP